jgi:hypothetical protein
MMASSLQNGLQVVGFCILIVGITPAFPKSIDSLGATHSKGTQLSPLTARIKLLENDSLRTLEEQTELLQGVQQSSHLNHHSRTSKTMDKPAETKRQPYPIGEWNPNLSENVLNIPNLSRLHRYRIEYHTARLAVLRILQDALATVGLDAVNLVFENAQIPSVFELLTNPEALHEYSKFIIEVLNQFRFSFERPQ